MPDPGVPQFRVSNEGEPFAPVDLEDLKRVWKIKPGDKEAWIAELARRLDNSAISTRCSMIRMLNHFNKGQLLAPWKHGEELDDAVFRLAATFPIRPLRQHVYRVPGDSMSGFDPNAFVVKLIEETGIPHTWEPVLARIPEGEFSYTTYSGGTSPDERREIRELLWAVWSKCHPNLSQPSPRHQPHDTAVIAMVFADFAIDNVDLAREFVSHGNDRNPLTVLLELEAKALSFFRRT